MRIGLGMSIVAAQGISPASAFVSRVIADGGTAVSPSHTQEAYNDAFPYNPTLLNTCDAGKAGVLYSIIAFSDYNTWLTRVTAGVVADTDFVIETVHDFQRVGLYDDASLLTICAAGDADDLYTFKPI